LPQHPRNRVARCVARVLHHWYRPAPIARIAPDPDDDVVIGTSLAAKAELVITGDKPLLTVIEHQGVRVVGVSSKPGRFSESTEQAAVTLVLKEFMARREQLCVTELLGTLAWDNSYDYKVGRRRSSHGVQA
jgi:hypothetical protein